MKIVKLFSENLKSLFVIFLLCITDFSFAQGLINNGAYITLANSAYIYVNGGAATGNFTNQDAGGFTGTVGNAGTIDVTGDWINNSAGNVFNASTGKVELVGSNNQNINGTTTTYFNNLSLLGTGTKTLNIQTLTGGGFAAPTGVLALNDRPLALNTYTLEVNNPATTAITLTTGYIISEMNAATNTSIIQWNVAATNGAYIFPFGTAAGTYIPLTLTKSAGNTNIYASTRATAANDNLPWQSTVTNMNSNVIGGPGAIPVVIDRWWDIYSPSNFTAAANFTYRGAENTTTYAPLGTFAAQNWSGALWFSPVGAGPGVVAGTAVVSAPAQVMGGTIATPWVLSNITAPLPVELLAFDAKLNNDKVDVTWSTASEINSDYFMVEKSLNGYDFENVGRKEAAGTSTNLINYSLVDMQPYSGLSYYRLKQVDKDGSFKYSNSIGVYINTQNLFDFIYVYVNDAGAMDLTFADNANESCVIAIHDMLGKELYSESVPATQGFNRQEINMAGFSHGIYYVSISNNDKYQTKKVMY